MEKIDATFTLKHHGRNASADLQMQLIPLKPTKKLIPIHRAKAPSLQMSSSKTGLDAQTQTQTPVPQRKVLKSHIRREGSRLLLDEPQRKGSQSSLTNKSEMKPVRSRSQILEEKPGLQPKSELTVSKTELLTNVKFDPFLPKKQGEMKQITTKLSNIEKVVALQKQGLNFNKLGNRNGLEELNRDFITSVLREENKSANSTYLRVQSMIVSNVQSPKKDSVMNSYQDASRLWSKRNSAISSMADEVNANVESIFGTERFKGLENIGKGSMIDSCIKILDHCNLPAVDWMSRKPKKLDLKRVKDQKLRVWTRPKQARIKLTPIYDCKLTNLTTTMNEFNASTETSPKFNLLSNSVSKDFHPRDLDRVLTSNFPPARHMRNN